MISLIPATTIKCSCSLLKGQCLNKALSALLALMTCGSISRLSVNNPTLYFLPGLNLSFRVIFSALCPFVLLCQFYRSWWNRLGRFGFLRLKFFGNAALKSVSDCCMVLSIDPFCCADMEHCFTCTISPKAVAIHLTVKTFIQ